MAKRLLILRHAEAAPAADGDDFHRRLTRRGKADAQALGAAAAANDLEAPTLALVSPAHRADETFAICAKVAGWNASPTRDPRLYEATPQDIRRLLDPAAADVVLVVGHNPTLAELAMGSIAGGEQDALDRMRRQFPAPCLAAILFDVARWDAIGAQGWLEHFLTPEPP